MARLFEYNEEQYPLAVFEDISAVPRPNGREEKISRYLYERALNKGLEVERDAAMNVVIRVPGTAGYEDSDTVILQAHMDMVAEKTPCSTHDFEKDPIELIVEGDLLKAKDTTLGADDGIGIGLALAAIEMDEIEHPPLEVLITTDEESEFTGAMGVTPEFCRGNKLINIDSAVENQVMVGSCGGTGMCIHLPMQRDIQETVSVSVPSGSSKTPAAFGKAFGITVTGLPGGHSGEDIHRGYGSAIQIMVSVLRTLFSLGSISLASIEGGTSRLAISRDCRAAIVVHGGPEEEAVVLDAIRSKKEENRKIYSTCKDFEIEVEPIEMPEAVYDEESFSSLLTLLTLLPDGIQKMYGEFPGVVASSLNLGIIREEVVEGSAAENAFMNDAGSTESIYLELELRGAFKSMVSDMVEKVASASEMNGAAWGCFGAYPAWEFKKESALRDIAISTYEDLFQEKMEPVMVHCGLECGILMEACGRDMDAISIGPNCWNFHSPNECLSISSAIKMWKYLRALLKNLR